MPAANHISFKTCMAFQIQNSSRSTGRHCHQRKIAYQLNNKTSVFFSWESRWWEVQKINQKRLLVLGLPIFKQFKKTCFYSSKYDGNIQLQPFTQARHKELILKIKKYVFPWLKPTKKSKIDQKSVLSNKAEREGSLQFAGHFETTKNQYRNKMKLFHPPHPSGYWHCAYITKMWNELGKLAPLLPQPGLFFWQFFYQSGLS